MEQNKSQAPADQIFTRSNNSKVLHRNVGQIIGQYWGGPYTDSTRTDRVDVLNAQKDWITWYR